MGRLPLHRRKLAVVVVRRRPALVARAAVTAVKASHPPSPGHLGFTVQEVAAGETRRAEQEDRSRGQEWVARLKTEVPELLAQQVPVLVAAADRAEVAVPLMRVAQAVLALSLSAIKFLGPLGRRLV